MDTRNVGQRLLTTAAAACALLGAQGCGGWEWRVLDQEVVEIGAPETEALEALDLYVERGFVTVVGEQRDDVRIEIDYVGRVWDDHGDHDRDDDWDDWDDWNDDVEDVREDTDVDVVLDGPTLVVDAFADWDARVDLRIAAPSRFDVRVRVDRGGATVRGFDGVVDRSGVVTEAP